MSEHIVEANPAHDPEMEDAGESWIYRLNDLIGAAARHVALLAAWIAMCGSLFFSEVLGWTPCLLCWYQRILMYPLAGIIAIGIFRRDPKLHWYVLPFSIFGAGVSTYHYLLIKTDWLPAPPCTNDVPCTVDYIDILGFINIPFMALTAFIIITVMMFIWASFQATQDAITDEEDLVQTSDEPARASSFRFDGASIAVVMIIVGVVLSFVLGSTFV